MPDLLLPKSALSELTDILSRFLPRSDYRVFIFGSRAIGNAHRWSDIDVGIEGPRLTPDTYFALEEALEESSLPYLVDIVQFSQVSPEFRTIAKQVTIPIELK